jgi:hypothetical protein
MDLDEETVDEELTPTDRRSRVVDILIAGILRMRGAPPAIRGNLLLESKSGLELVSESLLSVSDVGITRGDTDSQLSQMRQQAKRIQR